MTDLTHHDFCWQAHHACAIREIERLQAAIATHRMEVEKANTRWPDAGVESPPQVITADLNLWRRGGAEDGRIWENDRDRFRDYLRRLVEDDGAYDEDGYVMGSFLLEVREAIASGVSQTASEENR